MELGYFTFENLDKLIEMAEDLGYYVPDSIKEPKVTLKEIAHALRSGEKEKLNAITSNLTNKVRQDIITTAQKNVFNFKSGEQSISFKANLRSLLNQLI